MWQLLLQAAELVTHKEPSIATNVRFWYNITLIAGAVPSISKPRNPCSVAASLAVPSLNPHYVYSLTEFQCFASNTYAGAHQTNTWRAKAFHLFFTLGVVDESQKWVCPVQSNQALKEAFLAYANPPNSHQKLRTLSQHVSLEFLWSWRVANLFPYFCFIQLQDLGSAMRTPGVAEPHVLPALEPIINAFSTEPECRLNENTSLIVIAEACLGI